MAAGYGPEKPPHARTEVSTLDTLELRLRDIQESLARKPREDTAVRNIREMVAGLEATVSSYERSGAGKISFWKVLGAAVAAALVTAGSAVGYIRSQPDPQTREVKETLQEQGTSMQRQVEEQQHRIDDVEKKVDRLEDIAVEQQIQIIDGIEYLGKKIDAVSSRAERVEEPATLEKSRTKLERERARGDLFEHVPKR